MNTASQPVHISPSHHLAEPPPVDTPAVEYCAEEEDKKMVSWWKESCHLVSGSALGNRFWLTPDSTYKSHNRVIE